MGRHVTFFDVPFDVYRGLGFPGADDLGNMFQFQQIRGDAFCRDRDPGLARSLNPEFARFRPMARRQCEPHSYRVVGLGRESFRSDRRDPLLSRGRHLATPLT